MPLPEAALAGAALLYYLWKRHTAGQKQQAAMNPNGGNSNAQVLPGGNGNMAADLVEGEDAEAVAQFVAVAVRNPPE